MKISLKCLKEFVAIDKTEKELADLLTDLGLEVEGIEQYISHKGGLQNIVIGKVLSCTKHPDADRLKITQVEVGEIEPLQIVCGAPNVAAGQVVVVALCGAKLYPTKGEPFDIKKSKIRGIESNGMICAEDEIGLGESHESIIVLNEDIAAGTPAATYFKIYQDTIFEIGLTPNRNDAFSHLGVARDINAAQNVREDKNNLLCLPLVENNTTTTNPIDIVVEDTLACPRYAGVVIDNITVKESPEFLKNFLLSVGQKPINNVVDITNYILHVFGQPLHAFDCQNIAGNKIVVRKANSKEEFVSLDGIKRTLTGEELMICDADKPMCMAGVYGGLNSGVSNKTTKIFLESAYFDPKTIRRASVFHQLRTEAASHFEKSIDPDTVVDFLHIATKMIVDLCGGNIASKTYDLYPQKILQRNINFDTKKLTKYSGKEFAKETLDKILNNIDIQIDKHDSKTLHLPAYRYDVYRDVDVIEEVLRIYGVNRLELPNKLNTSIIIDKNSTKNNLFKEAATMLKGLGFHEIMNNSITKSKHYDDEGANHVRLLSSINSELDILRPSMIPSALEIIQYNINHGIKNAKLFEYGNVYHVNENKYIETPQLILLSYGEVMNENINTPNLKSDTYYQKGLLSLLLNNWNIAPMQTEITNNHPYLAYAMTYQNDKGILAEVGEVSTHWLQKFDIKTPVSITLIYWDNLLKMLKNKQNVYKEISKFPIIRRDLSIIIEEKIQFKDLQNIATQIGKKLLKDVEVFDIYRDENKIGKGKKSLSMSLTFKDENKTLTDKEVDLLMNKIMNTCETHLNGLIRK
jgi:phenylalanyl-tRNA synthetase beta chain